MTAKERVSRACIFLGCAFLILAAAFLLMGRFAYTLCALVGVVLCMELRVRLGYRMPRRSLFYVHLVASALTVGLLSLLAFGFRHAWLLGAAYLCFGALAMTGAILLYRNHAAFR